MRPYYEDEQVTLYHADCLTETAWLAADVLVTDPPYGMGYVQWAKNSAPIAGDPMLATNRADRVSTAADVIIRDSALSTWGARPFMVFGSWRAPKPTATAMRLVWDKGSPGPGGVGVFKHQDEEVYLGHWPNPRGLAGKYGSVIRAPRASGSDRVGHPTPKPLSLMELLIAECPPGVVSDPFAGSGSTLVAAKRLGRKAVGVELEERYCEMAATRLAQGAFDFGEAS